MIRTRFAPSPTGYVHIGSLRTALFAFLFARHNNGKLVLRIEDTDQNRKVEGAVENLIQVMRAVGINFDEGFYLKEDGSVGERGEFGPYLQSKRLDIYHKHTEQLIAEGKAYYCFCSEARLDELRKEQTALKKPPMYDRHCRSLSAADVKKNFDEFSASGKKPVVRFATPLEGQTVIEDLIYGRIVYENKILDDQVLLKSDGFPTYHLAVVVDDHFMQISHVIRGEEWIPSTPKHLLLYQAFCWQPPKFAHLPLTLNPDKSKLSKRQGDVAVEDFLKNGYLPEALVNFVAFLGWNPKTEQEIFSMPELIEQFDLGKINKAAPIFDTNKLDWLNSHYIRGLQPEVLLAAAKPIWSEKNIAVENYPVEFLNSILNLEKERLKKLSQLGEGTGYYFNQPEYENGLLIWKKSDAADAKAKLQKLQEFFERLDDKEFSRDILETKLKKFISENGFDNGSVLWPLRVALSGLEKSPGPFDLAAALYLGHRRNGILERINAAISKLS